MSKAERERPDDEAAAGRRLELWEALARAIASASGDGPEDGTEVGAPVPRSVTAARMRELLGPDTPPERGAH